MEVDCGLEKRKFYGVVGAKVVLRESGNRRIGDNPYKEFRFKGEQSHGAVTRKEVREQSNVFLK